MDSQTCLGGDRGWTPLIQQICVLNWSIDIANMCIYCEVWKCFNMILIQQICVSIVKYGSVSIWVIISLNCLARFWARIMNWNCINKEIWNETWTLCHETVLWYNCLISVNLQSNAIILVIAYIWFSISLLGCGAPYMGHHFWSRWYATFKDIARKVLGVKDSFLLFC